MSIKAVLFDAYGTLFDVYSVTVLAEQLFPGKGAELSSLWRSKQIEYTLLRSLGERYKPFSEVTRDALNYALERLVPGASIADAGRLMTQYSHLSPFPENHAAISQLKILDLPLGILSNGTQDMLHAAVSSAGMNDLFSHVLSVEAVRVYKPARAVYKLGTDALGLEPSNVLFVSSNGWDAAGAMWFGYTTFWVNRYGLPCESLDVQPSATGSSLADVVDFVKQKGCALGN